jgi:hypothetical protein
MKVETYLDVGLDLRRQVDLGWNIESNLESIALSKRHSLPKLHCSRRRSVDSAQTTKL